jgi:hypothetical protein
MRLRLAFALILLLAPAAASAQERLAFDVPHAHGADEARARVGYLLDYWRERFGVQVGEWRDGGVAVSGSVLGFAVNGTIYVSSDRVAAQVDDPGFLVRGRVSHYIDSMLRKYMHPRYEELDE